MWFSTNFSFERSTRVAFVRRFMASHTPPSRWLRNLSRPPFALSSGLRNSNESTLDTTQFSVMHGECECWMISDSDKDTRANSRVAMLAFGASC